MDDCIVSVVCPCLNERDYVEACIDSIVDGLGCYSAQAEVLVYDGGSTDGTIEIIRRCIAKHESVRIHLLSNPKKYQVHALNLGVKRSRGKVIVRCDMHALYPRNYVQRLVDLVLESDCDVGNIGTPHTVTPLRDNPIENAIAFSMTHPLAVGGGHRVIKGIPKDGCTVDTLLFGAWRASIFEKVGCFDERFIRGQDLEHNYRIRRKGFRVILHEGSPFILFPRKSVYNLCRMVYQYASTKVEMSVTVGYKPPLRFFAPSSVYFMLCLLFLLGQYSWMLMFGFCYMGVVSLVGAHASMQNRRMWPMFFVVTAPAMHFSHFLGVLRTLCRLCLGRKGTTVFSGTR